VERRRINAPARREWLRLLALITGVLGGGNGKAPPLKGSCWCLYPSGVNPSLFPVHSREKAPETDKAPHRCLRTWCLIATTSTLAARGKERAVKGFIEKRPGPQGSAYRVRVELPADPITGKRRTASKTARTRREAERVLAEWVADINRGSAVEPATVTVAELLTRWLTTVAAYRVRPTTLEDYQATIDNHIIPRIGGVKAQRLTASTVQAFYAELHEQGVGARTVQLCHLRLSQALAQAVKWGTLYRNVCDAVDAPRVTPKRGKAWSAEEARRFLAASAGNNLEPLWVLIATTGLRRGEALGVRWQDLDLDARTLRVTQAVVLYQNKPIVQEPKSPAARRVVKLDPETVTLLREHRTRQDAQRAALGRLWHDHDFVFCTGDGKVLNPNNLYRTLDAIMERAQVPRIRLHDLRHSHATLLLAAGTPLKVVSERLGHAKTSITLDTYAHVLPGMQDGAVDVVSGLLFAPKPAPKQRVFPRPLPNRSQAGTRVRRHQK
jgi:integrase